MCASSRTTLKLGEGGDVVTSTSLTKRDIDRLDASLNSHDIFHTRMRG